MKHKWEDAGVGNTYSEYKCKKCKRTIVVHMEDDDWHKKLDDCPKSGISVRSPSKTAEEEAAHLYADDIPLGARQLRIAFIEGAKWQRRQYAEQRNELERLRAIRDIKKEIQELEKKK